MAERSDLEVAYEAHLQGELDRWKADKKLKLVCPLDGTDQWTAGPPGEVPITGHGGAYEWKAYPVLPITCNNCGYLFFVNAIRVGVTPLESFAAEQERAENPA